MVFHKYIVKLHNRRTTLFDHTFVASATRLWNLLPSCFFSETRNLKIFKLRVYKHLLSSLLWSEVLWLFHYAERILMKMQTIICIFVIRYTFRIQTCRSSSISIPQSVSENGTFRGWNFLRECPNQTYQKDKKRRRKDLRPALESTLEEGENRYLNLVAWFWTLPSITKSISLHEWTKRMILLQVLGTIPETLAGVILCILDHEYFQIW